MPLEMKASSMLPLAKHLLAMTLKKWNGIKWKNTLTQSSQKDSLSYLKVTIGQKTKHTT